MEKDETKKTDSRKFIVWIVWLFVTLGVIAFCVAVMIITKKFADNLVGLIEKSLSWFFAISMMYLGVNVGQKVGLAFADKISKQVEETVEEK